MTTRAPGLTAAMRWLDAKGREWEIFEKLPFGLNLCRTTDRRFQGEWTTRDIRKALALNNMRAAMGSAAYREDFEVSKQSEAKESQGYVAKASRAYCMNCAHYRSSIVQREGYFGGVYSDESNKRCGKGGFSVNKQDVCNEHEWAAP